MWYFLVGFIHFTYLRIVQSYTYHKVLVTEAELFMPSSLVVNTYILWLTRANTMMQSFRATLFSFFLYLQLFESSFWNSLMFLFVRFLVFVA